MGLGAALLGLAALAASFSCGSERYARPPGPAPRYESAPLAPWTNGATPAPGAAGEDALESEIERALATDAGASSSNGKEEAIERQ